MASDRVRHLWEGNFSKFVPRRLLQKIDSSIGFPPHSRKRDNWEASQETRVRMPVIERMSDQDGTGFENIL